VPDDGPRVRRRFPPRGRRDRGRRDGTGVHPAARDRGVLGGPRALGTGGRGAGFAGLSPDGRVPATYIWGEIVDRGWDDHATVVGVSTSTPYAHENLIREEGLADGDYALFSDPDNGVAEAYGIAHDLDGMARIAEPRSAAYLVEPDRTVAYAWVAEEWPAVPDYDEIEDATSGGTPRLVNCEIPWHTVGCLSKTNILLCHFVFNV